MIARTILLLLLIQSYQTVDGTDFITRFGPQSPAYNEPLFFSSDKLSNKNKKTKRNRYRDKIKRAKTKEKLLSRRTS